MAIPDGSAARSVGTLDATAAVRLYSPPVIRNSGRSEMKAAPRLPAALLLAAAVLPVTANAEDTPSARTPDPRVVAALMAAGLPYAVDDGDFRLDYDVNETRTQRVWVDSDTATLDKLEFRAVWSIAARGQGMLPAETAQLLLRENARMIVGAWQVLQREGDYLVRFSAPVSATADAETLREMIEVVMYSADRIEKQLSGKDEF